jgi:hypothetical protein
MREQTTNTESLFLIVSSQESRGMDGKRAGR